MKSKKCISLILLIGILLSLTACDTEAGDGVVEPPTSQLSLYIPYSYTLQYEEALEMFEQRYPDVEVTVTRQEDQNYETAREEYVQILKNEVMAGKGPDLILFTDEFEDVYKTMDAGAFCDLTPYMEQDADFWKEYSRPVLDGGVFKEKQYIIPLTYTLPLLLSSQENLDGQGYTLLESGTFSDFTKSIEPFTQTDSSCRAFDASSVTLWDYLNYSGLDYMDYESKTIHVDTDAFRQVVDAYKQVYQQEKQNPLQFPHIHYRGFYTLKNEQTLFSDLYASHGSFGLMFEVNALGGIEKTPVVSAIPTMDGGLQATAYSCAAVRANSPNKQNAYNFIKLLSLKDSSSRSTPNYDIPVQTSVAKDLVRIYSSKIKNPIEDLDGSMYPVRLCSGEFIKQYGTVLDRITSCSLGTGWISGNLSVIAQYLNDCMAPYLNGEKDYETCIRDLETKLTMYLSE